MVSTHITFSSNHGGTVFVVQWFIDGVEQTPFNDSVIAPRGVDRDLDAGPHEILVTMRGDQGNSTLGVSARSNEEIDDFGFAKSFGSTIIYRAGVIGSGCTNKTGTCPIIVTEPPLPPPPPEPTTLEKPEPVIQQGEKGTVSFFGAFGCSNEVDNIDSTEDVILNVIAAFSGPGGCIPYSQLTITVVSDGETVLSRKTPASGSHNLSINLKDSLQGRSNVRVVVTPRGCSCSGSVLSGKVTTCSLTYTPNILNAIPTVNNVINQIENNVDGRISRVIGEIVFETDLRLDVKATVKAGDLVAGEASAIIIPEDKVLRINFSDPILDDFLGDVIVELNIDTEGVSPILLTSTLDKEVLDRFPTFEITGVNFFDSTDPEGFALREVQVRFVSDNHTNPLPFAGTVDVIVTDLDAPENPAVPMQFSFSTEGEEIKTVLETVEDVGLNGISRPEVQIIISANAIELFNDSFPVLVRAKPLPPKAPMDPVLVECVNPCDGTVTLIQEGQECGPFICPEPEPLPPEPLPPEPEPEPPIDDEEPEPTLPPPIEIPQNNTRRNVAIAGVALVVIVGAALARR